MSVAKALEQTRISDPESSLANQTSQMTSIFFSERLLKGTRLCKEKGRRVTSSSGLHIQGQRDKHPHIHKHARHTNANTQLAYPLHSPTPTNREEREKREKKEEKKKKEIKKDGKLQQRKIIIGRTYEIKELEFF